MTQVIVSPPWKLRRVTTSSPDAPGCGPDAVATVPMNRTHAASGTSARVAITVRRSSGGGARRGGYRAPPPPGRRPLAGPPPRPPHQRERRREDQLAEQEVAHDPT